MPAPFPPAIGLILVARWSPWDEISRSRISMGALAAQAGFVLIETYAVQGVAVADDATMTALLILADRCSVRFLLVADDVPMSYVAPISRSRPVAVNVVSSGLLART